MSDSDFDFEIDTGNNDNANNKQFQDEDQEAHKSKEQIQKEEAELKRLAQEKANAEARVKDSKKVDYDKKYEEKQKKKIGNAKVVPSGLKGHQLDEAIDATQVDDLLGGDDDVANSGSIQKKVYLNSEDDYIKFGKDTGEILYKGPTPYRVEHFFKALCNDLDTHCDSKQIKNIANHLNTIFNAKQKLEKEKESKGKKSKKPNINSGMGGINKEPTINTQLAYERNNNSSMVQDVMGADDDEYGEYGEEANFKKEGEADYDFM